MYWRWIGYARNGNKCRNFSKYRCQKRGRHRSIFNKAPIKNWINKNKADVSNEEAIENFLLSNVDYCLATFVLGIWDWHNDNIIVKKNGELFHIDFGHFLCHFKYRMGFKRKRDPFIFTRQFQTVLGDVALLCISI